MKFENIITGRQISRHLYQFKQEIQPEDLLKIIRFMAQKGKTPGYIYDHNQIFYTESNLITKQEFEYVFEHLDKNLDYLLDEYLRDDLADRVGSAIKIISSTTKGEIVQRIITNREFLFRFFKQDYIEKHCSKWNDFKRDKIFLPSASDETKTLAFALSSKCTQLSGKAYPQYWRLSNEHNSYELSRDIRTEITGDDLTINLKDNDDVILRIMRKFTEHQGNGAELGLHCEFKSISGDDLEIKRANAIKYSIRIFDLAEYFGLRKGSKFKTFSEGLRPRRDPETVKKYLGRKFIIAPDDCRVYSGTELCKELFELLAWNLKIEYMKDSKILCKVAREETQETITALWDLLGDSKDTRAFCFVEIQGESC
ncbi:MAG: hypothetical protein WBB67_12105 [bacterium]